MFVVLLTIRGAIIIYGGFMKKSKVVLLVVAMLCLLMGSVFADEPKYADEEKVTAAGYMLIGQQEFREGLVPVYVNHGSAEFHMNYLDENYKLVDLNKGRYSVVYPFFEGFAAVEDKEVGRLGYINRAGEEVVPCLYGTVYKMGMMYTGYFHDGKVEVFESNMDLSSMSMTPEVEKKIYVSEIDVTGKRLGDKAVDSLSDLYLVTDSGYTMTPVKLTYGTILKDIKVLNGTGNGLEPENELKREELVAMLVRLVDTSSVELPEESFFTDVPKDHWAHETLEKAHVMGITDGVEEGVFGLGQTVDQQQATTFLLKLLGLESNWDTVIEDAESDYNLVLSTPAGDKFIRGNMFELTAKALFIPQKSGRAIIKTDRYKDEYAKYLEDYYKIIEAQ